MDDTFFWMFVYLCALTTVDFLIRHHATIEEWLK